MATGGEIKLMFRMTKADTLMGRCAIDKEKEVHLVTSPVCRPPTQMMAALESHKDNPALCTHPESMMLLSDAASRRARAVNVRSEETTIHTRAVGSRVSHEGLAS